MGDQMDIVPRPAQARGLLLSSVCCAVAILVPTLVALVTPADAKVIPARAAHSNHVRRFAPRMVFPLNDSEWRDATPGMPLGTRYAVISGDPTKAERFLMRVELPKGYRVPPYTRAVDENLIVLSGKLMIGHGRSFDRTRMRALPSGSFQVLGANEAHYMLTIDGATVQIFGVGPFTLEQAAPILQVD